MHRNRIEPAALSRTLYAVPVVYPKFREMRRALDAGAIAIQELCLPAIQARRIVRTEVEISVHLLAAAHHKHGKDRGAAPENILARIAVGNVVDGSQLDCSSTTTAMTSKPYRMIVTSSVVRGH